jgi:sec-independent protein translocase protein TatB
MFDIAPTEFLIVALVALVVIGPKDLPNVMRTIGNWVGRARGMARHFRSGIDTMIREAELEEMEQKWKAENERIMREHPMLPSDPTVPNDHSPLPPEPVGEQDAPALEAPAAPPVADEDRRELP